MKNAYIVTFHAGTGGTFLSSLIYSWLADIDLTNKKFTADAYASAHHLEDIVESNHSQVLIPKGNYMIHSSETQALAFVKPINKFLPFVVRQHYLVNTTIVEQQYPDYQQFHIYFSPDDIDLLAANIFLKNILKNYNPTNIHNRYRFNGLDPRKFTFEQQKKQIKLLAKHFHNNYSQLKSFMEPCLIDKTINIPFAQMMKQPATTISTLKKALGLNMPVHIPFLYQQYIDANKAMIEKKCPWVNFFLQNE
jgi:hypothetical protein